MMSNTSADLWIEATAPLGDVVEQSGPFGGVCGPVGVDAKKTDMDCMDRIYIYLLDPQAARAP